MTRTTSFFALAGAATVSFLATSQAQAWEKRWSGHQCVGNNGLVYAGDASGTSKPGPISFSPLLFCSYDDELSAPKANVTVLNVHGGGLTASTAATVKACSVTPFSSNSSTSSFPTVFCSANKAVSGFDWVASFNSTDLSPAWGSSHFVDFGYIVVSFSGSGSSSANLVKGFFVAGT